MSEQPTRQSPRATRRKAELFSSPETLGQALYQLVHNSPQSVAQQAELLNLSSQFIYNIGNPNLEVEGITYPLKHLLPHTKLTKNRVVIDFIERQLGCVAVPVMDQLHLFRSTGDLRDDFLQVVREVGELSASIERGLSGDGEISEQEWKGIEKEGWDLIRQTALLLEERRRGGLQG